MQYLVNEILKAIRLRRQQLRYSKEYLGFKLGITQKSYCKIEKGESKLTVETLFKLCQILAVKHKEMV